MTYQFETGYLRHTIERGSSLRIYGGHDYYDCGLSMGIDPTITLVRGKSKTINIKSDVKVGLPEQFLELSYGANAKIEHLVIVFCGKVYQGVIGWRGKPLGGYCDPEYFWSADNLRKWTSKQKDLTISVYVSWQRRKKGSKPKLEEYFAVRDVPEKLRKFMIEKRISILCSHSTLCDGASGHSSWRHEQVDEMLVNPASLKNLGFAKALDPYTAFQELSMWIGGILGGSSPQIVIITDDKVLVENHGFDKYSFRSQKRIA